MKPHNAPVQEADPAPEGKARASVVSSWLEELVAATPVCRTILSIVADLDSTATDGSAPGLDLKATESATWKVVIKDLLTLGCAASLVESRSSDTGILLIGPELTLTATVSF